MNVRPTSELPLNPPAESQHGTEYLAGLYILTEDITYDPVLWLQYGRQESTNNEIEKLVDIAAPGHHNL